VSRKRPYRREELQRWILRLGTIDIVSLFTAATVARRLGVRKPAYVDETLEAIRGLYERDLVMVGYSTGEGIRWIDGDFWDGMAESIVGWKLDWNAAEYHGYQVWTHNTVAGDELVATEPADRADAPLRADTLSSG
jgi:hypothetical protein